jgi:hypothetical protein
MWKFLSGRVVLEGQFFETKLRTGFTIFDGYRSELLEIRERVGTLSWNGDVGELNGRVEYVENLLRSGGDSSAPLARALLEIDMLLESFDGAPQDLPDLAFSVLHSLTAEVGQAVSEKLSTIRENSGDFKLRAVGEVAVVREVIPDDRKAVADGLRRLKKHLNGLKTFRQSVERPTAVQADVDVQEGGKGHSHGGKHRRRT